MKTPSSELDLDRAPLDTDGAEIRFTVAELIEQLQKYPAGAQVVPFSAVRIGNDDIDDVRTHAWSSVHDGWCFEEDGDTVCLEILRNVEY